MQHRVEDGEAKVGNPQLLRDPMSIPTLVPYSPRDQESGKGFLPSREPIKF